MESTAAACRGNYERHLRPHIYQDLELYLVVGSSRAVQLETVTHVWQTVAVA